MNVKLGCYHEYFFYNAYHYHYSIDDVERANEVNAIETLLVTDELFR